MKTEGRQPEEGTQSDDNVVLFPREWIGPREDLVPIGVADPGLHDRPPAPEDFWGAGSADLQSAVRAPGDGGDEPARRDDQLSTQSGAVGPPHRRRARPGAVAARAVAGIAALVIVALVVGLLARGPSTTPRPGRAARSLGGHELAGVLLRSGGRTRRTARRRATRPRHVTHRRGGVHAKTSKRSPRHRAPGRSSPSVTPVATPVNYVPPANSGADSSGLNPSRDYTSPSTTGGGSGTTAGGVAAGPTSLGGAVGNNCNPRCQ